MSCPNIFTGTCKSIWILELFICTLPLYTKATLKAGLSHAVAFTRPVLWAACIWFHREVVNMPVFSTSLLFWHAQLRQSSSKVSAWGCGCCRSAFTHTNLHFSRFSPQYGWMLLLVSPCPPELKRWYTAWGTGTLKYVVLAETNVTQTQKQFYMAINVIMESQSNCYCYKMKYAQYFYYY